MIGLMRHELYAVTLTHLLFSTGEAPCGYKTRDRGQAERAGGTPENERSQVKIAAVEWGRCGTPFLCRMESDAATCTHFARDSLTGHHMIYANMRSRCDTLDTPTFSDVIWAQMYITLYIYSCSMATVKLVQGRSDRIRVFMAPQAHEFR